MSGPAPTDPVLRFLAKIEKSESCWLWRASRYPNGYGAFFDGQRVTGAHRWAYEHFVGPIPSGREIHHTCAVRACVNPQHLTATTRRDHPDAGPAVERAQTHCIHGHEFTPENTYIWAGAPKQRKCRKCRARRREEHRNA